MLINSSDSSGSSSGSSSSGSSSDSGSDNDEDALMDQIKSDLYHQRIARAQEIVNRRQAEWDIESDSELSVLASSLFNGIEDIESGRGISVESGDVEMGGTGSGLTDQDDQDSQGNGVDSGVGVPTVGLSPRRTRSGKVVKYKEDQASGLKLKNLQYKPSFRLVSNCLLQLDKSLESH